MKNLTTQAYTRLATTASVFVFALLCMGGAVYDSRSYESVRKTTGISEDSAIVAATESATSAAQVEPVVMHVSATMNDSMLIMTITVTNHSDTAIMVCPSFVSIRRRGPSTMMYASYGLGSSFDLEPSYQAARVFYPQEPSPSNVDQLQVQLVMLSRNATCRFRYSHVHGQSKDSLDKGTWSLYGELGLPIWDAESSVLAQMFACASFVTPRLVYEMQEVIAPIHFYQDHAWWAVSGDTTFMYLSRDEAHELKVNQLAGRALSNPRIPIVMTGRR